MAGLDWRLDHLPNGLRLLTMARPATGTVAVRAYVRAGSRYDVEEKEAASPHLPLGLAHCTEHLIFKGTRTHSQRELFAAVEHWGGVLEAGTSKEYTHFSAVVPRHGLAPAMEVLAELLTQAALREEDFWEEKLVILEEMRRAQDRESVIFDLFAETLWQHTPLRYPIQGSLQTLHDLDYPSLCAFHRQRYVAGNVVLVVCGDIEHEETRRLASDRLASLRQGPEQLPLPVHEPPLETWRTAHLEREVNQACLLLGVPTVSMKHQDRSALKIVERVLGMGGSARLYQRLREEARLVYSVRTVTAHYEDTGYFAVHTACHPQNISQVQQRILEEWDRLRDQGVNDDELKAAKSNYAGTLTRRFETNLASAGIVGVEALLHQVEPFETAIRRIHAVQPDDVQRAAQRYLNTAYAVAVSVGRGADCTP